MFRHSYLTVAQETPGVSDNAALRELPFKAPELFHKLSTDCKQVHSDHYQALFRTDFYRTVAVSCAA